MNNMIVTCEKCGKIYDDTYRLTYCPHEKFKMNCNVNGVICTTLEQVDLEIKKAE